MNKSQAYNLTKSLSVELGINLNLVRPMWRTKTKQYLINKSEELNKEIISRNKLYQKALILSNELNSPLRKPLATGTRHKFWKKELQRLRMIRLRGARKLEALRQVQRDLARPVMEDISSRFIELNKIIENKTLRSGDEMRTITLKIPEADQMRINEMNLENISQQLKNVVGSVVGDIGGVSYRIGVKDDRRNIDNYMSNPYQEWRSPDEAVDELMSRHIGPYSRGNDSNQIGDPFAITDIIVYSFIPNDIAMGNSVRSIAQANKTWYIVSPKSKFNCLYQSLAVCKNFIRNRKLLEINDKGQEARVDSGKQLKSKVKPTKDNYADSKSIQECCDWTRYPIILYNNVYQKVKTFSPKNPYERYRNIKCFEIQVSGNHCNALIRRKHIEAKYKDFVFPEIGNVVVNKKDENDEIVKKKFYHNYNKKVCAWDIETSTDKNGKHIPYACSIAWYEYKYDGFNISHKWVCKRDKEGKKTFKKKLIKKPKEVGRELREQQFWGRDCLKKLTEYIYKNKSIFNGYTLYAHNGGKYDMPLIIEKSFIDSKEFIIEGEKCVELNNAWIGFTLRAKEDRKFKLYFRDSCRLLPMSLAKLTKELNVEHQKLHETVNHNDINLINYNTFPSLKKYLTHDVFGLLEVIDKFGKGVYEDLGIDITNCFTGASLSKSNFFKNYYDPEKCPVYTLSDDNDKFIRDSYFGGRVECHKMGQILEAYYYDFTSLYPDVGREYLPYGEPELIQINSLILPNNFFGWVRCMVKTKNRKAIPKHGILKNSRLIFPIFGDWTEMNLFSEELDFDVYDYRFIEGVKFKKAKFKKKFFNDGFIKKAKSKKDGNPAMAQAYKIIINSGYGFWGLRTKDRDGVVICEPGDIRYREWLKQNRLLSISEKNGYMFCRIINDLTIKDFNVAVAAAISSYARSKLYSLITAIKNKGGEVYYMDTDSVICNINLNDHLDIKKKFQWDGDGSELGSLKNECDEVVEKLLKKLYPDKNENGEYIIGNKQLRDFIFKKLVEKENGNLSFDEGIITGCKQYALKKKVKIDDKIHNVEIVKLKGYSQKDDKLKYDDMVNLNKGISKSQMQTQFRCPKSNFTSETKHFSINSKIIKKSFRRTYTKGLIFKDHVLPLIV